jgi:predicted XRE-type DNA-binding protein
MNNGRPKSKAETIEVEESCGNVFRDLGLEDADLLLAKAKLIGAIRGMRDDHGLTDRSAAEAIGITGRDLKAIFRADFDRYSETELKRFVKALRRFVSGSQNGKRTTKKTAKVVK